MADGVECESGKTIYGEFETFDDCSVSESSQKLLATILLVCLVFILAGCGYQLLQLKKRKQSSLRAIGIHHVFGLWSLFGVGAMFFNIMTLLGMYVSENNIFKALLFVLVQTTLQASYWILYKLWRDALPSRFGIKVPFLFRPKDRTVVAIISGSCGIVFLFIMIPVLIKEIIPVFVRFSMIIISVTLVYAFWCLCYVSVHWLRFIRSSVSLRKTLKKAISGFRTHNGQGQLLKATVRRISTLMVVGWVILFPVNLIMLSSSVISSLNENMSTVLFIHSLGNIIYIASVCWLFKSTHKDSSESEDPTGFNSKWRISHRFKEDGLIKFDGDDEMIDLRNMLLDSAAVKLLGDYSRNMKQDNNLLCWMDIEEFKSIPASTFRECMARKIYEKYVKKGSALAVSGVSDGIRQNIDRFFEDDDEQAFTRTLFDELGYVVFHNLMKVYHEFKQTIAFQEYKESFNKVSVDDFDYMGVLGSGGFGRVLHVRKKTTGEHLAMKVVQKARLLHMFRKDPTKVNLEKEVLAFAHHPFICGLQYAFQTDELAIMVLDLMEGGELGDIMMKHRHCHLPEQLVAFYAAEIVLALQHLHEMDIVYRDLKPSNVLVGADGHITLVDMGLVTRVLDEADVSSETDGEMPSGVPTTLSTTLHSSNADDRLPLPSVSIKDGVLDLGAEASSDSMDGLSFEESTSWNEEIEASETSSMVPQQRPRRNSQTQMSITATRARRRLSGTGAAEIHACCGTMGFRAPEVVEARSTGIGYGKKVDWWSLGVTIYYMLTGRSPYRVRQAKGAPLSRRSKAKVEAEAQRKPLRFPNYMSDDVKNLIQGLLCREPGRRMDVNDIKAHPFFKAIDWDGLLNKSVPVPYKPDLKFLTNRDKPMSDNFTELMERLRTDSANNGAHKAMSRWDGKILNEEGQAMFEKWDIIAKRALRSELRSLEHLNNLHETATEMCLRLNMGFPSNLPSVVTKRRHSQIGGLGNGKSWMSEVESSTSEYGSGIVPRKRNRRFTLAYGDPMFPHSPVRTLRKSNRDRASSMDKSLQIPPHKFMQSPSTPSAGRKQAHYTNLGVSTTPKGNHPHTPKRNLTPQFKPKSLVMKSPRSANRVLHRTHNKGQHAAIPFDLNQ